jgi:hypothetical protein
MKDLFNQLISDADKPAAVPESIAKYAAALVAGTHEITSLTIRPKRTWVGLTDEEAQWLYDNCRTPSNLIDMTEAKLKEKNT